MYKEKIYIKDIREFEDFLYDWAVKHGKTAKMIFNNSLLQMFEKHLQLENVETGINGTSEENIKTLEAGKFIIEFDDSGDQPVLRKITNKKTEKQIYIEPTSTNCKLWFVY